jgi:N-acetylglucosamine-6-phosphate deacetylase
LSGGREIPMSSTVFRGTVVLPAELLPRGVVVVDKGRIVVVGPESDVKVPAGAEVIDAQEGYVSPGFVDIHTHGGTGSDYMDSTPEAVRISNRAHARHGTTTLLPTTTTGTPAQLASMLDAVTAVRDGWAVKDGARVAGVH